MPWWPADQLLFEAETPFGAQAFDVRSEKAEDSWTRRNRRDNVFSASSGPARRNTSSIGERGAAGGNWAFYRCQAPDPDCQCGDCRGARVKAKPRPARRRRTGSVTMVTVPEHVV